MTLKMNTNDLTQQNYEAKWNLLSNGEKAWMLNEIISNMNDEGAYYDGWLYVWPDGESYEQCLEDFADFEDYAFLEKEFVYRYSNEEYHDAGLYVFNKDLSEVIEAAHYWDDRLGLRTIKVFK